MRQNLVAFKIELDDQYNIEICTCDQKRLRVANVAPSSTVNLTALDFGATVKTLSDDVSSTEKLVLELSFTKRIGER